jgi:hypothetical protein
MFLPVGDIRIGWQVPLMIQEQMEFYGPFRSAKLCPRKQGQTKGDGGTVHGKQFVFKPEFLVFARGRSISVVFFVSCSKPLFANIPEKEPAKRKKAKPPRIIQMYFLNISTSSSFKRKPHQDDSFSMILDLEYDLRNDPVFQTM